MRNVETDGHGGSILDADVHSRSIRTIVEGLHESTMNLPKMVDEMLENALLAGGLFKNDLQVEFALSEDRSSCVVRLYLPDISLKGVDKSAPRQVYVSVIGKQHLRLKINMTTDGISSEITKTVHLPVKVSKHDVDISSKPDGSVHVTLRILKDEEDDTAAVAGKQESFRIESDADSLFGRLLTLFAPSMPDASAESKDVIREVPSSDDIAKCKEKFQHERLLISKCICDKTADLDSRAVCYGSLISKSVSMARKMGMDEFATSAKHLAIECAGSTQDKAECLENVANDILDSLYHRKGTGDRYKDLSDRIRLAIESEDDGPSKFESSPGLGFVQVIFLSALALGLFGGAFVSMRRRRNATGGKVQLSSVMTQRARGGERSASAVHAPRSSSGGSARAVNGKNAAALGAKIA